MENQKYYVIEQEYTGPNMDKRINSRSLQITTKPGETNMSHENRLSGWLGTTNDTSEHAHGEYDTIDAARTAISEILDGNMREAESDDYDETVVETYIAGNFEEIGKSASIDWCYEMRHEITATTTDDEIEKLVADCESDANAEKFTLDTDAVEKWLIELRDEKKRG